MASKHSLVCAIAAVHGIPAALGGSRKKSGFGFVANWWTKTCQGFIKFVLEHRMALFWFVLSLRPDGPMKHRWEQEDKGRVDLLA